MFLFFKVAEVKKLWKKLKDKHRYFSKKRPQPKSGDACPEEFDDEYIVEADGDADMRDELHFLDDNAAENFRQTFSLGGAESLSSVSDVPNDTTSDKPTSTYSYMSKDKKETKKK